MVLALGVCVRLLRELADGLTERRLAEEEEGLVRVSLVVDGGGWGEMLLLRR